MAVATNKAVAQFPRPTGMQGDPTHYVVRMKASPHTILMNRALTDDVDAPEALANVRFPIGSLRMRIPPGQLEDDFVNATLKRFLDAEITIVSLHTGAPGTNGDANELSGNGYQRVEIAAGGWNVVNG